MEAVLTAVVAFGVFAGLYAVLNRRAGRAAFPPEQRPMLAALAGCAAIAVVIGFLVR